ncbi:MAG: hypothetical protein CL876_05425 [Dehalococcoidales bacterium]|nr:hypothetical protein [Dehalococcoidales bacterium]
MPYSARLAEEIDTAYGVKADLTPLYDGQGTLEIIVDGEVVFSTETTERFPEEGEVVELVKPFSAPSSNS